MRKIAIVLLCSACSSHGESFPEELGKLRGQQISASRSPLELTQTTFSPRYLVSDARQKKRLVDQSTKSLAEFLLVANPAPFGRRSIQNKRMTATRASLHSRSEGAQMNDESKKTEASDNSEAEALAKRFTDIPEEEVTDEDKRNLIQGIGGFLVVAGVISFFAGGDLYDDTNRPPPVQDDTPAFGMVPKSVRSRPEFSLEPTPLERAQMNAAAAKRNE
mmetsp:Transcript_56163/g.89112  ORF Transcript_56163/g.89112 Transcript_56163/m.89112 type:complete len:219 (-) Transcript_56163:49-705(-)|eukprot:CAMPEP_0169114076 /NCGR_PEP_ID=MMETSP1015-20121227/28549_1 /TAXON_ID=342587 /ORGANISM="Karlodinium micrum, Strain CCMP2283" /LENGTH=218 /DNA_ID=CAMNT_0009176303 /DNA_START=49 /DNA_END=705 /DNA_ORIENTATION=+